MTAQRLWLGAVILATVAMTAWLYAQLFPPATRSTQPVSGVNYSADGVVLTQMRSSGTPSYRLRAASLSHTIPDDITHLRDIVLTLFPAQGTPVTLITPRADLLAGGQTVVMPGQVVITRPTRSGEMRLTTSAVRVNIHTQTADTQALATLTGPGYRIQGLGLHGNFADHIIELLHDVRSTYQR
ncbi:LPS export ABC transporter periplasmic protein LptC [Acidihalobacter ferrooxydans]|uniref:LPS export ABC transporter periplasmic protein LptC n=1 Tax=Acidihalobacter ferrooxydans TaxID=1765967 RepID=A0A1P8UJC2_9GAMM|nr:LPS export ABC transporter periplasmic protein LptC [Acidihalobacter ferrooxydans]APZ43933.1 LPS export ABC transporter periplasmic protein LptC [Acidihalobacter ferrooxydans]